MYSDSSPTQTSASVDITPGARIALLVTSVHGLAEYPLQYPEPTVVGRAHPADVCLDEPSISRTHARILSRQGNAVIEDLGSRNGTYVNNERVTTAGVVVRIGDSIRFGHIVAQIVLRARESTAAELALSEQLDAELNSEIERCLRVGKSLALVTGEVDLDSPLAPRSLAGYVLTVLRTGDLVALRSTTRFDILLRNCDRAEGLRIAERVVRELSTVSHSVRAGVAVAPADAATSDRLATVAHQAMQSVQTGVALVPDMPEIRRLGNREVIIADPSMLRVFRHAERAAALPMHVLLEGETGVGKEVVAEAIHALGPRASRPLVKVNCAAIPENLLESEFFGYERGAFSGANVPKAGLCEKAHGGTLFLDEIGELPPGLQAKLLRFVEDKRVMRLGGSAERFVDARIIVATHRDLRADVAAGRFRQDLFFRLSTLKIDIPPLRERPRELQLLIRLFADQAANSAGRSTPIFTEDALAMLEHHTWPGNVREVRNVITQAIVFSDDDEINAERIAAALGEKAPEGLPMARTPFVVAPATPPAAASPQSGSSLPLQEELSRIERERIVAALAACGGNQTKAAQKLGLPRRTFVSRMAALGIPGRRNGNNA